jgi:hypothetical protein
MDSVSVLIPQEILVWQNFCKEPSSAARFVQAVDVSWRQLASQPTSDLLQSRTGLIFILEWKQSLPIGIINLQKESDCGNACCISI